MINLEPIDRRIPPRAGRAGHSGILTITANPAVDRVYFVDKFEMGEVHRPRSMTCTAGGKGLNVARVSKILGEDVAAMGFVGGSGGNFISEEIAKLGIIDNFTRIEGETRVCVNISADDGKSGEILEPGPEVTPENIGRFISAFKENVDKYSVITISGSIPQGVPADFYAELITLSKGAKVILDASGDAFAEGIKAKPFSEPLAANSPARGSRGLFMVKPNKFELSKHFGKEITGFDQVKWALKELSGMGVELPVISLGRDGAMTYSGGKYVRFTTPDIPVVNTVGSGDSFVAGVAVAVSRGASDLDAVRLGMACGTANTQFAQTGTVSVELVNKFYKEIELEEI